VFKILKHSGSKTTILALDDTRARIEPYNAKSMMVSHRADSQVASQSSGTSLGQTNLPHQPQNSGISAHKYDPQVRLEQLKISKTDPSMWS
jgi:hypothetical protein